MKKDSHHRKRHNPAGPAGVWYSAQEKQRKQNQLGSVSSHQSEGQGSSIVQDGVNNVEGSGISANVQSQTPALGNVGFSPVWTKMKEELGLATPQIPSGLSLEQRHRLLRQYKPSNYVLLYEIFRGDHELGVSRPDTRLLVLIHDVSSHIHHNVWTVELHDESGATIRAWMEPKYVQEQMKEHQGVSMIRPGVVWMLNKVSMIAVPDDQEEKVERMLLISKRHVEKVWLPEQAKREDHDDTDQTKYMTSALQPEEAQFHTSPHQEISQDIVCAATQDQTRRRRKVSNKNKAVPIILGSRVRVNESEDAVDGMETTQQSPVPSQKKKSKRSRKFKNAESTAAKSVQSEILTATQNDTAVEGHSNPVNDTTKDGVKGCIQGHLSEVQPDKPKDPSPQVTDKSERTEERECNSVVDFNPKPPQNTARSFWNIQDTTMLDGLDDSDDDPVVVADFPAVKPEKRGSTIQQTQDSTMHEELKVSTKLQAISSKNKSSPAQPSQQTTSIFDANNLASLDMADFSDSE